MSDETERAKEIDEAVKAADAKKRADAEEAANQGEKLDKVLACLDSLGKRMDAYEAKRPIEEAGGSKKLPRDDGQGDQNSASGELGPAGGAGARLPKMDRRAEDAEEVQNYRKELGEESGDPRPLAADSVKFSNYADGLKAHIQSFADKAFSAWGKDAPRPLDGENIAPYRRRLLRNLKHHSQMWKDANLEEMSGLILRNAEQQIYADAIKASMDNSSYSPHDLREVRRRDPDTGHMIKESYGSPMAWMSQFCSARQLAKFNFDAINRRDR